MSATRFGPYGQHSQESNNAYVLPNTTYEKSQWELDAQIAARAAMAKRSSRSYAARVSRTKSRKNDISVKPARPLKPTVDTSFSRHRGVLPRQVYPKDNDFKTNGSVKKSAWLGIGKSSIKGRGLGITKGTPQPGSQAEDLVPATVPMDSLSPGTMAWDEISPSDRPIPIGISLPSDSLPDISPYQTTRTRSDSEATLATPSIIITPAAAMKSIWSPDTATESEYTPSIYSRGTFNGYSTNSPVPPVPALPANLPGSNMKFGVDAAQGPRVPPASHARKGTLDSIDTAFEDVDYDAKQKDRIMSSGTVFEEDEILSKNRNTQASILSIDTSATQVSRRSQGWWNYITTPFEFSRANSVWTQGGRNGEKTPDIPMMPHQFGGPSESPQTPPSSYIWSATEMSPSVNGGSPMFPIAISKSIKKSIAEENQKSEQVQQDRDGDHSRTMNIHGPTTNITNNITTKTILLAQSTPRYRREQSPTANNRDVDSPFSALSASPIVSTAAMGTMMTPRQVSEPEHPQKPQPEQRRLNQPQQQQQQLNQPQQQQQQLNQPYQQQQQQQQHVQVQMHPQMQPQQQQPQFQPQPINVNIVFQDSRSEDRRPDMKVQLRDTNPSADENSAKSSPSNPAARSTEKAGVFAFSRSQTPPEPIVEKSGVFAFNKGPSPPEPGALPTEKPGVFAFNGYPSPPESAARSTEKAGVFAFDRTPSPPEPVAEKGGTFTFSRSQSPPKPVAQKPGVFAFSRDASTPPPQFPPPPTQHRHGSPPAPQDIKLNIHTTSSKGSQRPPYQFPPPPQSMQNAVNSGFDRSSRASSVASTSELKGQKGQKKHRKVFNIMEWFPFGRHLGNGKREKKDKKEMSRRKKLCWGCCCCILILVLLAILIPVIVVLTRKRNSGPGSTTPSQGIDAPTQWLNLTGYPPLPTGISTIAQPEAVEEENGCVAPATVWSCAVPKEEQQAISPNKPDQPNLRFEITFQNGTVTDPSKTRPVRRAANPASAGAFVRSRLLGVRAAPSASPAPPAKEDYKFLGQTTDGNQSPFEGDETPFFISFLDPKVPPPSRLAKRADNEKPDITSAIPPPMLNPDGTAAPANLFPLMSGQPLRLFNRGKEDEHYGFFVYYDRSIFLKETLRNFTRGGNPADQNGGSPFDAATMRCTWAQTRFLVQIWTGDQSKKPLLGSSTGSDANSVFKRPGSFPYPVTITIDRHGGASTDKMLYCYEMDTDGKISNRRDNRNFILEDRGFGGTRVNPGQGPDRSVTGPIDGGTGGCRCQWQNWLS